MKNPEIILLKYKKLHTLQIKMLNDILKSAILQIYIRNKDKWGSTHDVIRVINKVLKQGGYIPNSVECSILNDMRKLYIRFYE